MCFVSDNVSTQLPTPPELQPLANRTRLWSMVSYLLIVAGIIFVGWGGWSYFQTWYQTNNPPARIIETALVDENTPTATVVAAAAKPVTTATPTESPTETPLPPTPTEVSTAVIDDTPPPPSGTIEPAPDVSDEAEATPEAALSLEDYPLVVDDAPQNGSPATESTPNQNSAYLSRVVADSIKLDAPVVDVGWQKVSANTNVWTVAEYAAGWHKNSDLPGHGGNIVLSGHHNIKGEVFRYIVDLEPGAVISLYGPDNQQYDYTVFDKFILKDKGEPDEVRLANARWIGPFNEERLTLVTCWPYNNNTHRVIVIAKPM
jgi:LPXTG-site transpeptidase (sortase) family protein